jgi:hypothetical protein
MEKKRRLSPIVDDAVSKSVEEQVTWPPVFEDDAYDLNAVVRQVHVEIEARQTRFRCMMLRHCAPASRTSVACSLLGRLTDSLRRLIMDWLDLRDTFRLGRCCTEFHRVALYVRPSRPVVILSLGLPIVAEQLLAPILASLFNVSQHVQHLRVVFDDNMCSLPCMDYLRLIGTCFPSLRRFTLCLRSEHSRPRRRLHQFNSITCDHNALAKTLQGYFPRIESFEFDAGTNDVRTNLYGTQRSKSFEPFPKRLTRLCVNAQYSSARLALLAAVDMSLYKMVKGITSWSLALVEEDFVVAHDDDDAEQRLIKGNRELLAHVWRAHPHLEELDIEAHSGELDRLLSDIVCNLPHLTTLRMRRDANVVNDIAYLDKAEREEQCTRFTDLGRTNDQENKSSLTCLDLSGCGELADSQSVCQVLTSFVARNLTRFAVRMPFQVKSENICDILNCLKLARHEGGSHPLLEHLELATRKVALEYAQVWNPHPSFNDTRVQLADLDKISKNHPRMCNATVTLMPFFVVDIEQGASQGAIADFFADKCWSSFVSTDRHASTLKLRCAASIFAARDIAERVIISDLNRPLPRFIHIRVTADQYGETLAVSNAILKAIEKRHGLPDKTQLHLYAKRFDHRFWKRLSQTIAGKSEEMQWGRETELHIHCVQDQTHTFVTSEDAELGYDVKYSVKTLLTPKQLFSLQHRTFRKANPSLTLDETSEDYDGFSHQLLSDEEDDPEDEDAGTEPRDARDAGGCVHAVETVRIDDSKSAQETDGGDVGEMYDPAITPLTETKAFATSDVPVPLSELKAGSHFVQKWSHVSKLVLADQIQLEWTFTDILEAVGAISCFQDTFEFETRVSRETARQWSWFTIEAPSPRDSDIDFGCARVSRRPEFARCFQMCNKGMFNGIIRGDERAAGNTYVSLSKHKKHPRRLINEEVSDSSGSDFDDQDIFPIDTIYELYIVHVGVQLCK